MGHAKRVSGRILGGGSSVRCGNSSFGVVGRQKQPADLRCAKGRPDNGGDGRNRTAVQNQVRHLRPQMFTSCQGHLSLLVCTRPCQYLGIPIANARFMCTYEDYSTHMCTMQAGIVQYHDVGVRATQSSAWATASAIEAAAKAYPAARSWPPPPCGATMARTLVVAPAQVRQLLR